MKMNILVFGASTTYGSYDSEGGWVQRLRKYFDRRMIKSKYEAYFTVYNLGVDGDTSRDLLRRFEDEVKVRLDEDQETLVIISIGINDLIINNRTHKHWVSPEEYQANLERLVKLSKKYAKRTIFVGLAPVDERKVDPIPWVEGCSYRSEFVRLYEGIMESVAKIAGVEFVGVFDELSKEKFRGLLVDGVHPNSEGHERIFEIVRERIAF